MQLDVIATEIKEQKMSKVCEKAQQETIGAVYILGQLIIWAKGPKPTPCHEVRIERWPYRIYPPQYQVVACVDEGRICPQMLVTYSIAAYFSISNETLEAMGGVAVVHHRGGAEKIRIDVIKLPQEQTKEFAPENARGGDGMPSPFAATSNDLPFPFSLSRMIETGRGEDVKFLARSEVGLHTATGYSESFSFREAFQNAIGNLPPDTNSYPDKLTNVRAVAVGANFGGIAGLNRMYVTVSSFY
jgi:hypothetical protein